MHTSKEFCIPDPPSTKGKGLEIGSISTELRSDWKASTSSMPFTFTDSKENEPPSNIKSFLRSCLKLIWDENVQIEVHRLIDHCDTSIAPAAMERAVNQIKRYVCTGREM